MAATSIARTIADNQPTDFIVSNHGSIFLLQPHTPAAQTWIDENLPDLESWQYFGTAISVDHRFIMIIVDCIKNDGPEGRLNWRNY